MQIISLVGYPFLPAKSGGQKGISLFYKYFSKYHTVTCISTEKNQPGLAEGYTVENILSNSRLRYINPFLFFTVRKKIREKKATHLILEHPYYGWLGILIKINCGVRLIVHSHNMEGNRWRSLGKWWWRILWSYERMTHRFADYNFFIQDEDKKYAIDKFGLDEKKCLTVSFGTELSGPPDPVRRISSYVQLRQHLDLPDSTSILLFNGAFQYAPNLEALEHLLLRINPLLQKKQFRYILLILGLDIPEPVMRINYSNVRLMGFVENLELYLLGSQVFLNPILNGGGIKTKLVEALAYNLSVVSSENGAIGIDPEICNGKLIVCPDTNWELFADAIVEATVQDRSITQDYYEQFYWVNITSKAARFIQDIE